MGYMRSFYEDNHFWELAPYETTDAGNLFANKAPLATANQDLSRIVAYFGDTVRQKLAIEGVPTGAAYASRWFNLARAHTVTARTPLPSRTALPCLTNPGLGIGSSSSSSRRNHISIGHRRKESAAISRLTAR